MSENTHPLPLLGRLSRLNWNRDFEGMTMIDPTTETLGLSPQFEAWAKDLNNWWLDIEILIEFPALAGRAWIKVNTLREEMEYEEDLRWFRDLVDDSGEVDMESDED
jgi:hypothetical protein